VVGYNYAESRYGLDATETPHRVIVGSETFPKTIVANWKLVQQYSHVIGDFTWTGWDYLGEVGIGAVAYKEDSEFNGQLGREFPYLLAYCGDIDITGYRRPGSYYREIAFGLRANPFIAVQDPAKHAQTQVSTSPWAWADVVEGWSWAGFEGKPIRVEVYSNAQEVELLLNELSVGRQPVAQVNAGALLANSAHFEIAYQTGELVAVSYIDGVESGRTVVRSAVGAPQLKLELDDVATRIKSDGQDLAHVAVSIVDSNGVLFNQAQEKLTVTVSGPAVLAGFGSSLPNPTVPYTSNVQTTWDGRALAIVRATGAGEITVTVSGETVGERSLSFMAG
jgi:beta-galactosidase